MTKEKAREVVEALREIIDARFALHLSPAGEGAYRREMEESLECRYNYLKEILAEGV